MNKKSPTNVGEGVDITGDWYYFWDDVNGKVLDTEGVKKARQDEIEFVKKMKLYDVISIKECYDKTSAVLKHRSRNPMHANF